MFTCIGTGFRAYNQKCFTVLNFLPYCINHADLISYIYRTYGSCVISNTKTVFYGGDFCKSCINHMPTVPLHINHPVELFFGVAQYRTYEFVNVLFQLHAVSTSRNKPDSYVNLFLESTYGCLQGINFHNNFLESSLGSVLTWLLDYFMKSSLLVFSGCKQED